MYLRIKNKMDAEIMREALKAERLDGAVINRIDKIAGVLDTNYGGCRGSSDMGGYILLFTDKQTYEKNIMKIMEFYHLNKELYEYSYKLGSEGNDMAEWQEELYLLSSDDALVIIHPVVQGDV